MYNKRFVCIDKPHHSVAVIVRTTKHNNIIPYVALLSGINCANLADKISSFIKYAERNNFCGKFMDVYNSVSNFFKYDRYYSDMEDAEYYKCVELIDNSVIPACYTLSSILYSAYPNISSIVDILVNNEGFHNVNTSVTVSVYSADSCLRLALLDKSFNPKKTLKNKKVYQSFMDNKNNIMKHSSYICTGDIVKLLGTTFYRADVFDAFCEKGCKFPTSGGCVVTKDFYESHKELFSSYCIVTPNDDKNVSITFDRNANVDEARSHFNSTVIANKMMKEVLGEL